MTNIIILVLIMCQLKFWEVQSVNVEGPDITKYNPCGLAFIEFTKISWNNWDGKINFHRYSNLEDFEVLLTFQKKVNVLTNLNLANLIIGKVDETTFTVKTSLHSTDRHVVFNVQLIDLDPNESDVPVVPIVMMNLTNLNLANLIIGKVDETTFTVKSNLHSTDRHVVFNVQLVDLDPNQSDVPVVSIVMMNNVTMCDDRIRAEPLIVTTADSETSKRKAQTCGRKSRKNYELMSLRTIAKPGDWPWHVTVNRFRDKSSPGTSCAGSIVSLTAVISTASSVFIDGVKAQTNQIEIVAGSVNLTDINDIGRQTPSVVEIIVHPAYTYNNPPLGDLAIIKVSGLVFTEYVQPICLWGPLFYNTLLYEKKAVVVGYGDTNQNNNLLRATDTIVQYDTACIKEHSYYLKNIKYFAFCGGYGNTSSLNPMNGDGGAGLVLPKKEADQKITWYLRGIFSICVYNTGTNCDPRHLVGYVDITAYYAWIYENAGLESNFEDSLIT